MQDTIPSSRRSKPPPASISSTNRSSVRSPATTASSSPRVKRTPIGSNLHGQQPIKGPSSHPKPTTDPTTSDPKMMIVEANNAITGQKRLCKPPIESEMATVEAKPADMTQKAQSINPEKVIGEAKCAGMNQKTQLKARVEPKKAISEAKSAAVNKKALQNSKQAGLVGEVQEIREARAVREQHNGQIVSKIRREKVGVRGKRRGYHVADLQARRKLITHRGYPLRRELNLRKNPSNDPRKTFTLTNLEEYLKERAPGPCTAQTMEDLDSPNSHLGHLQKPNLMIRNQRLVFVGESPSNLVDISLKDRRLLAKFSVRTHVSADEADDDPHQCHSDRSGCGMSLHWPANSRGAKNESLVHYAGSCFSVSRRRVGSRRNRMAYMYNSERSMSSFYSDTETAPLMTEPEPFHDYSDDLTASCVELERDAPRLELGHELMYSRFRENGRSETSSIKLDTSFRKQRETVCKHRSISQKYRPKSFKDLVGQSMVAEALSNAILRSKIAPVYLFHGPRGTGKTSAAKIFTCAMNCLSIEELRPCGLCKECVAFNAGNNYDVKEVDAAGNNEIESMRLILKHLALPPSLSRYKVFIMDDCHVLTPEAWNALLKSLEEPPDYVVFILITTNLEQLPRAAISRCQKFMFTRIKDADIVLRLRKLAQLEKVEIDSEALHFIASQSDGSFRDAETMLDQLSLLGKRVTLAIVREMVGLIPDDELINLLELALSADTVNTVNMVRELMGSGVEPLALVSQLAALITDILAGRCRIARSSALRVRRDQQERLQQALRVLSDAEKQLRSCSDRTTWLTAAFVQFASNDQCSHPSSSQGTSATQSPAVFLDASEKESLNLDCASRRRSWGGKEKWDSHSLLQLEYAPGEALGTMLDGYSKNLSGSFMDNRIYPCDQFPQSGISVDEKVVWGSPGVSRVVHNKASTMSPCKLDNIWQKVLQGSRSNVLKQLLQGEGRLVSLSVTEAFAIVHLEFRSLEHKAMAERAKENISNAFQVALFCPVKVEISLSSSQGQSNFTRRAGNPSVQKNPEHHSKHMLLDHENGPTQEQGSARGGSFRKSSSNSFRNMAPVSSSPRCHDLEHRKSIHGFEGEGRTYSKRSTDTSVRDLPVQKGPGDATSDGSQLPVNGGHVFEYSKGKEQRSSFDDPRFSTFLQWSETKEDFEEYSSDLESEERYAPGLLCWKGRRMKDDKAKHHALRRRRARFLLRLVPCAKEEEQS